jgi:hypothetical protein
LAAGSPEDPKVTALRAVRCLNPHPEQVSDPTLRAEEFFDARDVVQVKYEMIRRVSVEGDSVTTAAAAFGYSRPSYYAAAATLAQSGLEGLVAAKPGPRAGHKLTDAATRRRYDPAVARSVPAPFVRLLPAGPALDPEAAARGFTGR